LIAHAIPIPEVLSSLKDLVAEKIIPEGQSNLSFLLFVESLLICTNL